MHVHGTGLTASSVVRLFDGSCSGAPVQRFATLLIAANVPQEWTLADAVGSDVTSQCSMVGI